VLPVGDRGEYPGVETQDYLLALGSKTKFSGKASGKERTFHSILYNLLGFIQIKIPSLAFF
jgi:hypothetical protein